MPVTSWSTTASSNATADAASGISWPEGMSPAQVNDSARAMMAVIKGDFDKSHAANGYQKLPNGLIIQWGTVSFATGADVLITFPIAFPGGILHAAATPVSSPPTTRLVSIYIAANPSLTQVLLGSRYADNGGVVGALAQSGYWVAIGY